MKKLCLITSLILGINPNIKAPTLHKEYLQNRFELISLKYLSFSEERLTLYLTQFNHPYPEVLIAQARLETSLYTSLIYTANNNLFGMRHPRIRPTTSLGSRYKHAKYEHWTDSVDDYMLWYEYHQHRLEDCYYSFLKGIGYAEDKYYIKKLKKLV